MKPALAFGLVMTGLIVAGSLVLMGYQPAGTPSPSNPKPEPRHPVTLKMEQDAKAVVGEAAPEIDLKDHEGKPFKLSDWVKDTPVVVVMIKDGCPCSMEAQPFFNQLYKAYEGKVKFVAVSDADKFHASKFRDDFKMDYPVVLEPTMHTFEAFQSPRSVYTTLIAKGGTVRQLWPGYSQQLLGEINAAIAHEVGVAPASIDVHDAPERPSSGCKFGEPVGS